MSRVKALLRRARLHYCSEFVSDQQNRRNQHKWVRAVNRLGDKWLFGKPQERRNVGTN